MLDEKNFAVWTSEFNPTSRFEGSWDKGSRIVFLGTDQDGNLSGMVSRIKENIPSKFVSIEHLGIIQNGQEILEGSEVEKWAGALENSDNAPAIPETDLNLVMHVSLPILSGHLLKGSDAPGSMGFEFNMGNNVYISLHPDTRDETRRVFRALSEGGKIEHELQDMFWGDYYGSCRDKFGVQWMFNCSEKE